jgi:4-diphosphocytidyl-2-C-methyl-D-erythritol kinase
MLNSVVQNDFEPLVLGAHQPVAQLKQDFYETGAEFSQLSGSGSAVYALYKNEPDVKRMKQKIGNRYAVSVTPPHFHIEEM